MRARYRAIERFKNKYPIQTMCEIFEVSRSGFCKWRKQMQQPVRHSELDQIIITCQSQAKQTYGYRRVLRWMERNNTQLYNASTILRHMRKLDLLAQIRRRHQYTLYKQGGYLYENLLNRQFAHNRMNCRWVTDITYIITPHQTYYLCVIMDLCGRYFVSYRFGTEMTAILVSDTVKDAFSREKEKVANGLVLHSDQICQYTSEEYFALTEEYHFSASMSSKVVPMIMQLWKTSLVHSKPNASIDVIQLQVNKCNNSLTNTFTSITSNALI